VDAAEDKNFFSYRGKRLGQRVEIVILFESVAGCRLCGYFFLLRSSGQSGMHLPLGILLTEEVDEGGACDIEKLEVKGIFLRKGVPELP